MSERSALIVGPGRAFGFELARDLHADGYTVAVMGTRPERMDVFSRRLFDDGIMHYPVIADVCDYHQLDEAIMECADMLPPWEVAVYNVKDSPHGDALSLSPFNLRDSFEKNVIGAMRLGSILVDEWRRTENATYILTGGGYKDSPDPNKLALGVAKGALHTMAAAMRPTFAMHEISIKEVIIDGRVDPMDGISPSLVSQRYVNLVNSSLDTIVIDDKSK